MSQQKSSKRSMSKKKVKRGSKISGQVMDKFSQNEVIPYSPIIGVIGLDIAWSVSLNCATLKLLADSLDMSPQFKYERLVNDLIHTSALLTCPQLNLEPLPLLNINLNIDKLDDQDQVQEDSQNLKVYSSVVGKGQLISETKSPLNSTNVTSSSLTNSRRSSILKLSTSQPMLTGQFFQGGQVNSKTDQNPPIVVRSPEKTEEVNGKTDMQSKLNNDKKNSKSIKRIKKMKQNNENISYPPKNSTQKGQIRQGLISKRMIPNNVLKKIIFKMDQGNLFNCRLVSKKWNGICRHLLENLQLKFRVTLRSTEQLETFFEIVKSSKISLFKSFILDKMAICPQTVIDDFLTRFGCHINCLELKSVVIWIDRFRELITQLPNLESLSTSITRFRGTRIFNDDEQNKIKSLKLKKINFYGGGGNNSFQNFLEDFFEISPNLEIIQADPGDLHMMSKDFRETLIRGTLTRSLKKLVKFDFELNLSDETLKKLSHSQHPLKECVIIVKEDSVRNETLYKLLKSISSTLKYLHLTFEINNLVGRKQTFRLPLMKSLETLIVINFYGGMDGLGFLQKCYNLKYLDLLHVQNFESMLPLSMNPVKNLQELKLTRMNYTMSSFAFHQILAKFPNIHRLTLEEVQDSSLRAIFLELPLLRKLTLKGTFTDEGLTGIPIDKCKEIIDSQILYKVNPENLRRSAFLADLKKMEHLHLESHFLTDVSINLAVVLCSSLTHLTIISELVTDISLITIANRMQKLIFLDISQCPILSWDLKQLVQTALKDKFKLVYQTEDQEKFDFEDDPNNNYFVHNPIKLIEKPKLDVPFLIERIKKSTTQAEEIRQTFNENDKLKIDPRSMSISRHQMTKGRPETLDTPFINFIMDKPQLIKQLGRYLPQDKS